MKEQLIKFKDWWSHLAMREKQAILLGSAVILLFIVYQWIWAPLLAGKESLKKQIEIQTKTYIWMKAADQACAKIEKQTLNKNKPVPPVVFLGMMQKQIEQAGLEQSLSQLKQSTNESIEMHFQKVEFDKLMQLLIVTLKGQSVSVAQMSVLAESDPGLVNADITLKLEE